jgi:hypothetical protein
MKRISFIVYYPYQWFIYRNIYNEISADKREVIVDLSANPELQDEEVKMSIVSLLQREKVSFRILAGVDRLSGFYFEDFFSDVEVIVSCWENGCVSDPALQHIKKVNTTYGIAKELTLLRPTRSIYDVILAYGKRDQRYFELLTKAIAIGNPRLDNFYNSVVDDSVREKLSIHFKDKKKKIILYVPTHGDLGSTHEMLSPFERLSKQNNVIFKPHYYTLREEKDIVEKYRQIESLLVIDDTWDTIEVMSVSDIVVSDNSSVIFDAMQVDKPLVVCDFLDNQFLDIVHKKLRFIKKGVTGALTYSGSLEQEIKSKGLVMTITKPDHLDAVLENIGKIDGRYKHFRKEIVRDNFQYTDGRSSKRAADIILRVYDTEREHIPGILQHAYLAYNNRIYQQMVESGNREITLAPLPNTVTVWIYCEPDSSSDEVLVTAYSALLESTVVRVCISGIVEKEVVAAIVRAGFSDKVDFFENHTDGLSFIQTQLGISHCLLFVKAKTVVKGLNTINNFQIACGRNMIFFSENIVSNPKDAASSIFYQLKREVLGFQSLSKNTLISISHDKICAIEKSAVFIDNKTLLGHCISPSNAVSFEGILSAFVAIDSLKSKEYNYLGISYIDYALMPNFFRDKYQSKGPDVYKKLVAKGLILYSLGIPIRRWPDKKIVEYLSKIAMGNLWYYHLLKLILFKILAVKKYMLLSRMNSFIEWTSQEMKRN